MTHSLRRRDLLLTAAALGAAGALGAPGAALAQSGYPNKSIRLLNPFAPGGSADVLSRLIAARLSQEMGVTVFVENQGGAGGTIGSSTVIKAAPDGYTLLLSNVASQAIAPTLYAKLPYDALNDFEHIAMLGDFPNVLVVGPAVKAANYAEFIAQAKANPGSFTFGSAGNGSTPHLSAELLKLRTGIDARHVPYRGAGPALLALMGGETSFQFENVSTAIPQIKSGRLRALGVTSAARAPSLPDVPTMQELGLADFVIGSWYGISAPPKTPPAIKQAVAKATVAVLNDPALKAQLVEMGVAPSTITPEQFRGFVAREIERWSVMVKASGARVD